MKVVDDIKQIIYPFYDEDMDANDSTGTPKIIVTNDLISLYNFDNTFSPSELKDLSDSLKKAVRFYARKKRGRKHDAV